MLANGVQIKQIQEWLGHSHYSTTADVYSHLDFSSKVQSGNIMAKALDMGNKLKQQGIKTQIDIDLLRSVRQHMTELGFQNINDYFAYLDSKEKQNDKHSDLQTEYHM